MGRMLEALSRATPPERPAERVVPMIRKIGAAAPEKIADTEPAAEEQLPFIEVGGPRSVVDASADVLAAVPAAAEAGPSEIRESDDNEGLIAPGTIAIWCSWTLRPGIRRES